MFFGRVRTFLTMTIEQSHSADVLQELPELQRDWVGNLPAFVAFVVGYLALIVWFKGFDLYHTRFEASGALIVIYNLFRILFAFYLFWIVHAVGSILLRLIAGHAWNSISFVDQLGLGFFAGAGVWHVFLLILGYLNLYTVPVAIAVTLPIVALSYGRARATLDGARKILAAWRGHHWTWWRLLRALLIPSCLAAGSALLLVKGLYPAGGHDYFTHYFYYYQAVIDRAGLWPNNVWYHYYYSKGAGLYFLGILLTDPLAPQLVTFCFVAASALALLQLLRRIAPDTAWPWVGVILYWGLYIHTPGQGPYRAHGGWGDFEKLHELNAALVISILWMVAGALERRGKVGLAWASAAASTIVAAVVINTTAGAYLGFVLVLLAVWFCIRRNWFPGSICVGLTAVAGTTLVGILAINYLTTGLINDQGILLFWQFADLEKLNRWGALPLAITLHWGVTGLTANSVPLSLETIKFLFLSLRLDLLYPLFAIGAIFAALAMIRSRARTSAWTQLLVLAVAILAFILLAVAAGRSQPISFYRYSSFALPIVIAAGIALSTVARVSVTGKLAKAVCDGFLPLILLAGCIGAASASYRSGAISTILTNAWRFGKGTYSIDNAYTAQGGWAGRLPWGAIYPGARGVYAVVGPHTRVWTFHIHSYCMLPDCRFEHQPGFIMTRDLDRVLFGTPEEGKQALQAGGLKYFLFSRELPVQDDWITFAPLFAPDNISRFLGIRWTDGKTALLTWLGPDTVPLDEGWLADYRRAVEASPMVRGYPYAAMRKIYEQLRASPHPWRSFPLPWEGNRPY